MGWTRGVDNATHFTCLLQGGVPASGLRVSTMVNTLTIAKIGIVIIPGGCIPQPDNIVIPLRKEHAAIRVPSIAMTTLQSLFTATAAPSSSVFLVTTQA